MWMHIWCLPNRGRAELLSGAAVSPRWQPRCPNYHRDGFSDAACLHDRLVGGDRTGSCAGAAPHAPAQGFLETSDRPASDEQCSCRRWLSRFLLVAPISHIGGLAPLSTSVLKGSVIYFMPDFDPVAIWQVIARERITTMMSVDASSRCMVSQR